MKTKTVLSNIVVAAGGALLITTVWMAGLTALVNVETARASAATPTAIVRLDPIVVTAKRLAPSVEKMNTIVVTASRLDGGNLASADLALKSGRVTTPVSHVRPIARPVETRI